MKGKHAKDTANKLKLAKRTLALCFAVVFLCSCMLPVFATGSSLTDVLREAVEETAASAADTTESSGGTMMDSFQSYYASYTAEYKTTYRFWLSEKDSCNLPDTATTAASDLEQYDGFYKVVTIKENTTLTAPDGFKNPTDPTGEGRKFEGWYYYSEYGSPEDFAFDGSSVILDKSSTIDVFAKWGEAPVEEPAEDEDKTAEEPKADDTVKDDTTTDDDTVSDDDDVTEDDGEKIPPAPDTEGDEIPEDSEESVMLADAYDDGISLTASGSSTIKLEESIRLSGKSGDRNSSQYHKWSQSGNGSVSISYPDKDSNNYQVATVTGTKTGWVTVTHKYYSRSWKSETFSIYVENLYPATVFILKTPTSDRNSNGSGDWGVGVAGAVIDVSGATWEGINVKQNVVNHVVSWPDNTLNAGMTVLEDGTKAWDMPKDTKGWTYTWETGGQQEKTVLDQILQYWGAKLEEQLGITNLSADDIEHVYVVPYKISHNNSSSGKITRMHIDCEIRVVCTKAYVAKFNVKDPEETEYKAITSENYAIRNNVPDSIPENNGQTYPKTKTVNGVQYVFDGWYNEANEKVDDWEYKYNPTSKELADGVVNFYGRYVRANTAFTIKKLVTGNIADLSEKFNFTITVKDSKNNGLTFKLDGAEHTGKYEFELGNDGSVSLTDVPVGATITIQETGATGYSTSAKLGDTYVGTWNQPDGGTFKFTVASTGLATQSLDSADDDEIGLVLLSLDDDVDAESVTTGKTVTVINSKDLEVPTGVILDTFPYILMLAAVGGGAIAFFLRKRHHDDED